jgi:hypothetical protein
MLALLGSTPRAASSQTPPEQSTDRTPIVGDLRFEGVNAVDEFELRQALSTKESRWLPWREKPYFDKDVFEADLKRIGSVLCGARVSARSRRRHRGHRARHYRECHHHHR